MTTLYAIVDKDRNHMSCCMKDEESAWMDCFNGMDLLCVNSSHRQELINEFVSFGYRCIPLHTYDPEREVVVDRSALQRLLDKFKSGNEIPVERTTVRRDEVEAFLSAGKEKP